jgi:multidrug efflux pump subunit AcrA (membrane-fusion protein)
MNALSRGNRHAATRIVIGVVSGVVLIAWLGTRGRQAGRPAGAVATVERRTFAATVLAIGAVKPQIGAEVRVGSRLSGRVQRLRSNIGDHVRRGQVIAELETEPLDAIIAQRQAELSLAAAKAEMLERLAPDQAGQAAAEVARFEATAKLAADEWTRQQALLRDGAATRAEADAARERSMMANAQLEEARRALELVRSGSTEQRRQAAAERARAAAALRSAMVDRSFAVITSPITGVVASVSTQEGETVAAGLSAPTFLTVVDLARLQVNAYVDEVDIGKVRAGQRVVFTVDALPARDFDGTVAAIYPSATIQDNVVKYVVAVGIAGEYAGMLRPEMTASVRIRLEAREVLAVPARSIRREESRSVVYVERDGRFVSRPVRVGWRDGPWIEIVEGLRQGEHVLLDPPAAEGEAKR